jgi:membrane protease YdiL (CAAX protease family)
VDRPLPPEQRARVDRPAVTWGIGDFVWIYFAGIAASVVFAQIGVAITGDDPNHIGGVTTALALAGQFGGWIVGLAWVSRRKGRGTLRADFGLVIRARDAGFLLVGVALEIGLGVLIQPLVNLVNENQSVVNDLEKAHGLKLAALALVAGIVAPVCEELLFRGLLLRSLARRLEPAPAIAVCALVFALAHLLDPTLGTLAVVPALFALGAVSGVLALRTGDLSRSIFLHVGFNLLTTASALYTALRK